jgi:hypothetical protein
MLSVLLVVSGWGIPKLISGNTEMMLFGVAALFALPVAIYQIMKGKQNG